MLKRGGPLGRRTEVERGALRAPHWGYFDDLPFFAGADLDFLAGDCEDDFVDFLVALFIRSILPFGFSRFGTIVVFPEIKLNGV